MTFVLIFRKEWTCDQCMMEVSMLAMAYSIPESVAKWTDALSGPLYCANPILGLTAEDIAHCAAIMERFVGPVMRSLDAEYSGHAQYYCWAWYDGVCPKPSNTFGISFE